MLTSIANAVAIRRVTRPAFRASLLAIIFVGSLIPVTGFSLSHYLRVLTGDLSMTGFIIFGLAMVQSIIRPGARPDHRLFLVPATAMITISIVLYPTSLGLTYFDLYAAGYYPIILGPLLFVLLASALWFGLKLPAVLLSAGFLGFAFGLLESDNLWDYLIDPVVAIYSLFLVVRYRHELPLERPSQRQIETMLGITVITFLAFAVYLAKFNHDAFQYEFVIEDGFIEWCTVIVLFTAMLVCGNRFIKLRQHRPPLFLTVTLLLTLLCLFGAGEEISWGQRIFGLETPDYLKDRNAQGELGIHNLVVEINGEEVKLNKLIFGTGLAIALLIYLFIATPLYRSKDRVRAFFNAIAAPMPRNYQIVGYLLVVATVELLVDSSKRGEMTEFAGSIVFALNVIYPYNPEIFDPEKSGQETGSAVSDAG